MKSKSATIARQHGQLWESYIRKECTSLYKAGQALVRKNWEAPAIPGKTHHIKREKSKPDFSGFLLSTGLHVDFEAKASLSTTSFPFSQIADHQIEHLEEAHTSGAIAFVYILDGLRRKWVLPLPAIITCMVERSSFPYPGNEIYQKRRGETWLDTWRRLEEEGLA